MKKKFNIKAAQAGAKVITRDGRRVEIIKYNYKNDYPIIAVVTDNDGSERVEFYKKSGDYYCSRDVHPLDLFIEEEPKYRPYANAKEMDAAIKEHGMFVKHWTGKRLAIKGYDEIDVSVGAGCNYRALLEYFKWIDGTPCGILEGGEE